MRWFSLELFPLLGFNAGLKLILDILGVVIIYIIIKVAAKLAQSV
jgi:hypothetical protein